MAAQGQTDALRDQNFLLASFSVNIGDVIIIHYLRYIACCCDDDFESFSIIPSGRCSSAESFMTRWIAAEGARAAFKACRNMPERDVKNQGEGSPKQACSYWFARHY